VWHLIQSLAAILIGAGLAIARDDLDLLSWAVFALGALRLGYSLVEIGIWIWAWRNPWRFVRDDEGDDDGSDEGGGSAIRK